MKRPWFAFLLFLSLGVLLVQPVAADVVVPTEQVQNRVIVREGASSSTREVGSLRPGEQAEYLGQVPSWYHVRLSDGIEGFVPKRWTRVVPEAAAASFTIDVVDVGTGLGILVRGQDFSLVYDAGSNDDLARGDANRFLAYLRAVSPTLTTIDHVILSHPHRDHVELLPDLLRHYQVRHVWDSGAVNPICGYRMFLTAVRDETGVAYHSAVQDFGTRTLSFEAKQCYGQALPAETLQFPHASRISEFPVALGAGASMTFLHADGSEHDSYNENSLVVRLDLGGTRVLLMGDAEAGGRRDPSEAPSPGSIEGMLLNCCRSELSAPILVVGHHGSKTSSRAEFLDAVGASTFVISSGPTRYGSVVLPDQAVIDELTPRGSVFRTDLGDGTCRQNTAKVGPDADGKAGGCDNIRITVGPGSALSADYLRPTD